MATIIGTVPDTNHSVNAAIRVRSRFGTAAVAITAMTAVSDVLLPAMWAGLYLETMSSFIVYLYRAVILRIRPAARSVSCIKNKAS